MIEPRSVRLHLHRRESSLISSSDTSLLLGVAAGGAGGGPPQHGSNSSLICLDHEEPERPIHPGLEFEVIRCSPNLTSTATIGNVTSPRLTGIACGSVINTSPASYYQSSMNNPAGTVPLLVLGGNPGEEEENGSDNHCTNSNNSDDGKNEDDEETAHQYESRGEAVAMGGETTATSHENQRTSIPSVCGRRISCTKKVAWASRKVKFAFSFLLLLISGTAHVVLLKLQSIPMYNYPNFLNLFSHFMYIPLCFAYIIPVARYGLFKNTITAEHVALSRKPFVLMGLLDCLATSMQIFSSVYLPGPLLVLLPQAVIPFSMVASRYLLGGHYRPLQYVGAAIVVVGIVVVLGPILQNVVSDHTTTTTTASNNNNYYYIGTTPVYVCEALPETRQHFCTVCQQEDTAWKCLSHYYYSHDPKVISDYPFMQPQVGNVDDTTTTTTTWSTRITTAMDDYSMISSTLEVEIPACQWVPQNQSAKNMRDDVLIVFWSCIMVTSTIPMTLSAIYKEVALRNVSELDPIYLTGWISIFQFIFALLMAIPAGILASPSVQPWNLPSNLWNGWRCFLGQASISDGCHPDSCSHYTALFVCLCLVCHVLYTTCMMLVLKYGSSIMLFMAQTILVPIGNLVFTLPIMPQHTTLDPLDGWGLCIIMVGLVLYKFMEGPHPLEGILEDPSSDDVNTMSLEQQRQHSDSEDSLLIPSWLRDVVNTLQEPLLEHGSTPWFQDFIQQMQRQQRQEEQEQQQPQLRSRRIRHHDLQQQQQQQQQECEQIYEYSTMGTISSLATPLLPQQGDV